VTSYADWKMPPALAAGLEQLGWPAEDGYVRDAVPAARRGNNVVAVVPPAPAWAMPVLAGLLGQAPSESGPGILILTAPAQLTPWAYALASLTEGAPIRIAVDASVAPAPQLVHPADVLITSPEAALARHTRSLLGPERFRAVVFAWPEQWNADEAVTALMQDMPRECQRIVMTAHANTVDQPGGMVERYARKAIVCGPAPAEVDTAAPDAGGTVYSAAAAWSGRAAAVANVLAAHPGRQAVIWTADRGDFHQIALTTGGVRDDVHLACRSAGSADLTVCYDLPPVDALRQLARRSDVVVLMPPGAESYLATIAPQRKPMSLASAAAAAAHHDERLRAEVVAQLDGAATTAGLYALAPLFERHDPQQVAAAVFALWQRESGVPATAATERSSTAPAVAPKAPTGSAIARLWIGAGKKDDATVGDFVAVLVKEAGMDRTRIGKIDVRDTFALVEVPAADAEDLAVRLVGKTIRKRKLSARVDRGGSSAPRRAPRH
jgi:ATP-dependent RNA helicase DeaD